MGGETVRDSWCEGIRVCQSLGLNSKGPAKRGAGGKERAEKDDAERLPLGRSHRRTEANKPAKAGTNHPAAQTTLLSSI
jgi:hypothetical protein